MHPCIRTPATAHARPAPLPRCQRAPRAGIFPYSRVTVKSPLLWDHRANKGSAVGGPPQTPAPPAGSAAADDVTVAYSGSAPDASKSAESEFRLMRVDAASGTSLVRCCPRTGRSHQLRIHLAHLGFPIANDHLYGGSLGPPRPSFVLRRPGESAAARRAAAAAPSPAAGSDGMFASATAQLREASGAVGSGGAGDVPDGKRVLVVPHGSAAGVCVRGEAARTSGADDGCTGAGVATATQSPPSKVARVEAADSTHDGQGAVERQGPGDAATVGCEHAGMVGPAIDAGSAAAEAAWGTRSDAHAAPELVPEARRDPMCPHCPRMCPRDYPLDLQPMWLHAQSYSSDEWSFAAPLPDWAAPEFVVSGTAVHE